MLKHSFCHIPGIGSKLERKLWLQGVHTWESLLNSPPTGVLSPSRHEKVIGHLRESAEQLRVENAPFFSRWLPPDEQWRLFSDFRHSIAYIDIESTGSRQGLDHITTVALYDGTSVKCYVHGRNLDSFPDDIAQYRLLVTYNGKSFDVPFIEQYFGIRITAAHIDLRFGLASLGYTGGLKGCERQLGIDRGPLDGFDGYLAVLLWHEYVRTRDERALETLLAYNIQDVVNLEPLLVHVYNEKLKKAPFDCARAPSSTLPVTPYAPHSEVLSRVRGSSLAL